MSNRINWEAHHGSYCFILQCFHYISLWADWIWKLNLISEQRVSNCETCLFRETFWSKYAALSERDSYLVAVWSACQHVQELEQQQQLRHTGHGAHGGIWLLQFASWCRLHRWAATQIWTHRHGTKMFRFKVTCTVKKSINTRRNNRKDASCNSRTCLRLATFSSKSKYYSDSCFVYPCVHFKQVLLIANSAYFKWAPFAVIQLSVVSVLSEGPQCQNAATQGIWRR